MFNDDRNDRDNRNNDANEGIRGIEGLGKPKAKTLKMRSHDLAEAICGEFSQQFIASNFGISKQAVSSWLKGGGRDIFYRMANFLHELHRMPDPGKQLSVYTANLLLSDMGENGYRAVEKPTQTTQFKKILECLTDPAKELSGVQCLFTQAAEDGKLDLNELEQMERQGEELAETVNHLLAQIQYVKKSCDGQRRRGGFMEGE